MGELSELPGLSIGSRQLQETLITFEHRYQEVARTGWKVVASCVAVNAGRRSWWKMALKEGKRCT